MAEIEKKASTPRKPRTVAKTEAKPKLVPAKAAAPEAKPKPAAKKAAAKAAKPQAPAKKKASVTPIAAPPREVSHEEIAALARKFWEERGHTDGHAEEDWLRAERELHGNAR